MRCVLPWLDRWAAKKPDAAAFEDEKTCLTWRQLHDTAKRIGTYLARQLPPRVPVAPVSYTHLTLPTILLV